MQFRVASFNVENLVGDGIRYYDRYKDTAETYGAKANWVASTLTRARADIVGIQEVWLEAALRDVAKRSSFFARDPVFIAAPGAGADNLNGHLAKRPRVGLISRYPIRQAESFHAFPASVDLTIPLRVDGGIIAPVAIGITQFQRPVLRAVVDVGGLDVVVYVTHLKSKGPLIREGERGADPFAASLGQARSTIVRAAEAAALRHIILADLHDTRKPAIVLGDLNDTPDASSTQTVRGPGPVPDMSYDEKRAMWDVVLYSTFKIALERSPTLHTHVHDGERDILDHILVSEEFFTRNPKRIGQVARHEVINDHLCEDERDVRTPGCSDHGVPIAEIQLLTKDGHTNP
jgi:endonuclease/exonuclease/phosphatase family metal-dependent hydrolase